MDPSGFHVLRRRLPPLSATAAVLAAAAIMIVPVAAQTLTTGFPDVSCQAQSDGDFPARPRHPDSITVDDDLRLAPTIVTGKGDNGQGTYLPVSQDGKYDLPLVRTRCRTAPADCPTAALISGRLRQGTAAPTGRSQQT
jgi:hypothetical protein